MLSSSQPGSMRDLAIMWMETHYAPFADLLHTVRTGQPAAEHFYGEPFFSWLSHHPEQASRFTAAIANLTAGSRPPRSRPCRWMAPARSSTPTAPCSRPSWRPTRTCAACYSTFPTSSTTPPKTLARHGVDSRADCVGGDFLESVPADGDACLLSLVLHDWTDQLARRILENIAAAGGSGARLLVIEFVVPPGDAPTWPRCPTWTCSP